MKKPFFLTFAFVLFAGLPVFGMDYTIELASSWSSGWNGATIDVLVNEGVVLDGITLEDGSGPESHPFSVNPGDEIKTVYTPTTWSYYNYYNEYQIKNEEGDVIAESGQDGEEPEDVSYTVPGLYNPDPADNAVAVDVTATTLDWDWDYPDPPDRYIIDIGTSKGASDIVDGAVSNQSQYTYGTNWDYSTQYFWTVTAIFEEDEDDDEEEDDDDDEEEEDDEEDDREEDSEEWRFTTIDAKAGNPNPAHGALSISVAATTLDWEDVNGADSYTIDIGTSEGASDIVDDAVCNQSQYTHDQNWDYSEEYFWTVTTVAGGTSYAGDEWSFRTSDFAGAGTSASPYEITSLQDLRSLSENNSYWDDYFVQTEDIDASPTNPNAADYDPGGPWGDGKGFSPVGNRKEQFTGSYNGQGHIIEGLYINRDSSDEIGLFGITDHEIIKNLGLESVDITGRSAVGALVGENDGGDTISNCYITGNIAGTRGVGGLVGINAGTVSNSYARVDVTRSSGFDTAFGAFCGENDNAAIRYCYSTGNVFESPGTAWNSGDKGFLGYDNRGSGTFIANFFDEQSSNQSTATGAFAKTTEEMKTESTFTDEGWDFDTVWVIDNIINDGYPYLQSTPPTFVPKPGDDEEEGGGEEGGGEDGNGEDGNVDVFCFIATCWLSF